MRVVHQLIAYFHAHGALSEQQLADLRQSGFLPEDVEIPSDEELSAPLRPPVRPIRTQGWPGAETDEVPQAIRTAKPLGIAPLCQALAELGRSWPSRLGAFFAIAGELEHSPSLRRSLLVIRKSDRTVLKSVLAALLARRDITLSALSAGLDIQEYRKLLKDGRQPTKALGAYRALMRTYGYTSLGKYAWVLRHEPVNDVFNLIQAKRAVLRALHDLYAEDPDRLVPHLRGHAVTNLFWAFVILRSALADDPWLESRHKSAMGATYLDKLWPPHVTLERAALYGLFMAPAPLLVFLTRDLDVPADARGNPPWRIPRDWTSDAEKHYIKFNADRRAGR